MSEHAAIAPVVNDYEPAWQVEGLALARELHVVLAPLALRVEHIGSTAIPGMAAKPIFDLQVSVDDLQEAERAFGEPLAGLGFVRSVYQHDHVPAGRDDSPENWVKRLWTRRGHGEDGDGGDGGDGGGDVSNGSNGDNRDVNLHVRVVGSPNERLALLFRDWFRAHPEAVPAYGRFKRVLAGAVGDIGTYVDVKDPVVDLVGVVAESWAAATGWSPVVREQAW